MFPERKSEPAKRRSLDLSEFGLTSNAAVNGDDDCDLQTELAEIAVGAAKPKSKPQPKLIPDTELDKMIAESLKDIDSDDADDLEIENDIELLLELQGIVGGNIVEENNESDEAETASELNSKQEVFLPTSDLSMVDIIKQRIEMYKIAATNAKAAEENAKVRRFNRGLRTLNDILRQVISGKTLNPDNIPPEVSTKVQKQEEIKHDESEAISSFNQVNSLVRQLRSRQQEYRAASLQSERSGDTAMVLQFSNIIKQFDDVIKMCEDGQEVDLSDMPPPPNQFKDFMENLQTKRTRRTNRSNAVNTA